MIKRNDKIKQLQSDEIVINSSYHESYVYIYSSIYVYRLLYMQDEQELGEPIQIKQLSINIKQKRPLLRVEFLKTHPKYLSLDMNHTEIK